MNSPATWPESSLRIRPRQPSQEGSAIYLSGLWLSWRERRRAGFFPPRRLRPIHRDYAARFRRHPKLLQINTLHRSPAAPKNFPRNIFPWRTLGPKLQSYERPGARHGGSRGSMTALPWTNLHFSLEPRTSAARARCVPFKAATAILAFKTLSRAPSPLCVATRIAPRCLPCGAPLPASLRAGRPRWGLPCA